MSDKRSPLEELLEREGAATIAPVGTSMLPALREGRDLVLLKKPQRLQKYDVVLYRATDGGCVLHRIVKIKDGELILCGDNSTVRERGYSSSDILAVVDKIIRDGRAVDCHCLKNRIYERLWCAGILKRIFFRLRRLFRKK